MNMNALVMKYIRMFVINHCWQSWTVWPVGIKNLASEKMISFETWLDLCMVIVTELYDVFEHSVHVCKDSPVVLVVITSFWEKKWILMCRKINTSVADDI